MTAENPTPTQASQMLLTGAIIDARTALRLGLLNAAVPAGAALIIIPATLLHQYRRSVAGTMVKVAAVSNSKFGDPPLPGLTLATPSSERGALGTGQSPNGAIYTSPGQRPGC